MASKVETQPFPASQLQKKTLSGWGVFYAASSASPQGTELVGHHSLALAGQIP